MPNLVNQGASTERLAQRGQVVVIVALFLVVLVGFAALAVDYGSYLIARRSYQNIADSAALTGSVHLSRPIDSTKRDQARAAAWEALDRQLGLTGTFPTVDTGVGGYTDSGWTLWVDTITPTNAGAKYPGSTAISGSTSVFVRIERDNPAFLSRIFGINGRRIDAWATAGNAPTRWAVLALCPRNGACPPNARSVTLAGTTTLRVQDGDLGSNWGLDIQSNADDRLQLPGDSQAYLVDTYCHPSTYLCDPAANVSDGAGTSKVVRVLPAPVEDPNYPEPSWLFDATSVPTRTLPTLTGGTVIDALGPTVRCDSASPRRLGPGRYDVKVIVPANTCVIFDPTFGLTAGQRPGIYLFREGFEIGNNSFVVGDGITLFFDTTMDANASKRFDPVGGIVINNGNAQIAGIPSGKEKYGAWTTKGMTTWSAADSSLATTWSTPTPAEVGIAFYVRKTVGTITGIFNMAGQSPLMFRGILYAPRDNVGIAGSGLQAAVGQLISWTVTYNGNSDITQLFDGPSDAKSYLIEPRTGQPDS